MTQRVVSLSLDGVSRRDALSSRWQTCRRCQHPTDSHSERQKLRLEDGTRVESGILKFFDPAVPSKVVNAVPAVRNNLGLEKVETYRSSLGVARVPDIIDKLR